MGSSSYTVTINSSNKNDVVKRWNEIREEDKYESGAGAYAGNAMTFDPGISFHDNRLSSEIKAEEWLLDNHRKWSQAMACSFYVPTKPSKSDQRKLEKAMTVMLSAKKKKFEGLTSIQEAFRNRQSSFVGCSECGSRINHKFLVDRLHKGTHSETYTSYPSLPNCLVCGELLINQTNIKRIEGWNAKLKKAEKALIELREPKPSTELGWVVGGWAAS